MARRGKARQGKAGARYVDADEEGGGMRRRLTAFLLALCIHPRTLQQLRTLSIYGLSLQNKRRAFCH
jgi:hypothetical protein